MTDTAQSTKRKDIARRDVAIDTLRGLAIILMVAGHVIGGDGGTGMRVPDDSPWRYSYLLLEDLRMPLFTALSGFVYGLRPLRAPSRYGDLVMGKARRLLVPLLTVGTAFVLLQAVTPGTNADSDLSSAWRLYVYGQPGHFWFLQAIFLIFLLVGALDAFGILRSPARVTLAAVGAALLSVLVHVPAPWDVFSVNGAIRLLPFFLIGYGVSVYWPSLANIRFLLLAAASTLLLARACEIFAIFALPSMLSASLGVALGAAGILTLLAFRNTIAWSPLARLGYFSFSIYLLHVFGTAPTRMILDRAGIESEGAVFTLCLLAGLALPILFEITLGRIGWVSRAFLGQKPYTGRRKG